MKLIAYASINHGGVIAIGLGIGGTAAYGVLLYVVSNAFIKAILFLTAGKIEAHYRTEDMRQVSGLIKDLPYSGLFLMVGTFALLGLPALRQLPRRAHHPVRPHQRRALRRLRRLLRDPHRHLRRHRPLGLPDDLGRAEEEGRTGRARASPRSSRSSSSSAALVAMGLYLPAPVNALFRQVAASLGGR